MGEATMTVLEEFKKKTEEVFGWRVTSLGSVFPVPQIMVLDDSSAVLVFFGDSVEDDTVPKRLSLENLIADEVGYSTSQGTRLVPMETMANVPSSLVQAFSEEKWSREKVSEVYGV